MVNTSDILPNTPRYLKVPLIGFNCILWLLGVILIALGGYSLSKLKDLQSIANISIPAGLIVLGVFIIVLTVVGCVVAYKEKLVGLIFFTIFMLILLICLIGVGGGAFTYRNDSQTILATAWARATDQQRAFMENFFVSSPSGPNNPVPCCGWITLPAGNRTYPSSSCIIPAYNDTTGEHPASLKPYPPCGPIINDFVDHYLYIAGAAAVVIGVIEFISMLFSLFLIIRLCRNPRSRSYD